MTNFIKKTTKIQKSIATNILSSSRIVYIKSVLRVRKKRDIVQL